MASASVFPLPGRVAAARARVGAPGRLAATRSPRFRYHKCRVSNFSTWGKKASPDRLKHEAAVAALTAQIYLIELEAMRRDPLH